jgi:hypothetical protein
MKLLALVLAFTATMAAAASPDIQANRDALQWEEIAKSHNRNVVILRQQKASPVLIEAEVNAANQAAANAGQARAWGRQADIEYRRMESIKLDERLLQLRLANPNYYPHAAQPVVCVTVLFSTVCK